MKDHPARRPPRRPLSRLLPLSLLLLALLAAPLRANPDARSIQIMNESGRRVEVHWVHPQTGEQVLQSTPDILHGADFALNSFASHHFQVRELPTKRSNECGGEGGECRVDFFTVNWNQDQVVIIRDGVKVEHTDSKTIAFKAAGELLEDCKSEAKRKLRDEPAAAETILEDLGVCAQKGVSDRIQEANEEITFQANIRKTMAGMVENYTCADPKVNTTEAKRTESWKGRPVKVMFDRPGSKIHVIENFLTPAECNAVDERARPALHDATVKGGGKGNKLSAKRIKVHWEKEGKGDLITRLSRRVYDYVNHALQSDIKENGQEDLMAMHYFGRGAGDHAPDRLSPHCDGDCNNVEFQNGNRIATVVMHCKIATVGGATRFPNANIHINPKRYSATFVSNIDPDTMRMDREFTEHSGCPVVEGEKKVVAQWVRLGVDDKTPWTSFTA